MSQDEFFDEDGNLIATSWGLKEQEEESRRKQDDLEKILASEREDLSKRFAVEDRMSELEKKRSEDQRKRQLRDNWMSMPKWIKAMPRVPMSAPPTEGKKQKALYALTRKVTLTEDEYNSRKENFRKLKLAMDDYERIHQAFPSGTPLAPVTVVSLGEDAGGTLVTRLISSTVQQSREDLGDVISLDFAHKGSNLGELYGTLGKENVKKRMTLRHVVKQLPSLLSSHFSPLEVISIGGNNEYYLDNRSEPEKRIEPTVREVAGLYKFMSGVDGVCVFDCDLHNRKAFIASAIISHLTIFVLPLEKEIGDILQALLALMERDLTQEDYQKILDNSLVVFTAKNEKMNTEENKKKIMEFVDGIRSDCSFRNEAVFIPYDPGVKKTPFSIANMRFGTAHIARQICGHIVDTVISRTRSAEK